MCGSPADRGARAAGALTRRLNVVPELVAVSVTHPRSPTPTGRPIY